MKIASLGLLAAFGVLVGVSTPSSAAGISPATIGIEKQERMAEPVHWRGYRHCHRSYDRVWCHGGEGRRYYRHGYSDWPGYYRHRRPGFELRFGSGPRYGHYRRHRWD